MKSIPVPVYLLATSIALANIPTSSAETVKRAAIPTKFEDSVETLVKRDQASRTATKKQADKTFDSIKTKAQKDYDAVKKNADKAYTDQVASITRDYNNAITKNKNKLTNDKAQCDRLQTASDNLATNESTLGTKSCNTASSNTTDKATCLRVVSTKLDIAKRESQSNNVQCKIDAKNTFDASTVLTDSEKDQKTKESLQKKKDALDEAAQVQSSILDLAEKDKAALYDQAEKDFLIWAQDQLDQATFRATEIYTEAEADLVAAVIAGNKMTNSDKKEQLIQKAIAKATKLGVKSEAIIAKAQANLDKASTQEVVKEERHATAAKNSVSKAQQRLATMNDVKREMDTVNASTIVDLATSEFSKIAQDLTTAKKHIASLDRAVNWMVKNADKISDFKIKAQAKLDNINSLNSEILAIQTLAADILSTQNNTVIAMNTTFGKLTKASNVERVAADQDGDEVSDASNQLKRLNHQIQRKLNTIGEKGEDIHDLLLKADKKLAEIQFGLDHSQVQVEITGQKKDQCGKLVDAQCKVLIESKFFKNRKQMNLKKGHQQHFVKQCIKKLKKGKLGKGMWKCEQLVMACDDLDEYKVIKTVLATFPDGEDHEQIVGRLALKSMCAKDPNFNPICPEFNDLMNQKKPNSTNNSEDDDIPSA